jgi:uncharacterized protein (TIGR00369 family)
MFPPARIVCLTEETVETLYLLGEQDRIVGISGYVVRPPQARREKPRVSAFTSANIDKILALKPDLVLTFSDLQADIAADLIRRGLAEPKDIHLNPAGTVHGGLAATMLDSCMGLAIHSTLEKGVGSTTLEFKMSFVRPITPETGPIKAEGKLISRGRRVGTAEGRVTDSDGRLLVHGTTTCLIFES